MLTGGLSDMTSDFEEFNRLLAEEMKRSYSEKAIGYINEPKNREPMEDANGYATITDSHGDELHLWLRVEDDVIKKATFMTKGCLTIVVAASGLTELVKGKTVKEAMEITPKALRDFIGKTPRKTWHCTILAVNVLREALQNHVLMEVFGGTDFKVLKIDL